MSGFDPLHDWYKPWEFTEEELKQIEEIKRKPVVYPDLPMMTGVLPDFILPTGILD